MRYVLQIEIETEKPSELDLKAIESSCNGTIIAINQRPQITMPQASKTDVKS